jgi:hypothetical protein
MAQDLENEEQEARTVEEQRDAVALKSRLEDLLARILRIEDQL